MIYAAALGFLYGALTSESYDSADKLFDGLTAAAGAALVFGLLSLFF